MTNQMRFTEQLFLFQPTHQLYSVFRDFVFLFATKISLPFRTNFDEFWLDRKNVKAHYTEEEQKRFEQMSALCIQELMAKPYQDFLGKIYREQIDDQGPEIMRTSIFFQDVAGSNTEKGSIEWTAITDANCGTGSNLIKSAQYFAQQKIQYKDKFLFIGYEPDYTVGLIAYIQLSLIGVPGYIILKPETYRALVLYPPEKNFIFCTPEFYRFPWRRNK